jgi:mRNA interferase MazF
MVKKYVPQRGDIVWLNFTPQTGHEQRGKRPAIVISPIKYNEKVGLGLFCPITSKEKKYPFEVAINIKKVHGVILADQIKSLDWTKRDIKFVGKSGDETISEVLNKILILLDGV